MRRLIQWSLSVLAIAGLGSSTAAQAQATHQTSNSGKDIVSSPSQQQLVDSPVVDGATEP